MKVLDKRMTVVYTERVATEHANERGESTRRVYGYTPGSRDFKIKVKLFATLKTAVSTKRVIL